MPSCQVVIARISKKSGKKYFVIPNPVKDPASKHIYKQWISYLKNGKWCFENYMHKIRKLVHEDHFTPGCFKRNHLAEYLNVLSRCKK